MEWVELSLAGGALVDEIAALIASTDDVASEGVHVRGEEIVFWVPHAEADAAAESLRAAARRLAEAGFEVDAASVRVRPAPPEHEWRDAWKKYFKVTRMGRRIVIVPSWETYAPEPDDLVMHLDPGRAFGTGAHASTRLCLREIEALHDEGLAPAKFLDVGCGSGILSIAAALVWPASRGLAIDIDPIAVSASIENLERNGVGDRVRTSDEAIDMIPGTFELVIANIQADTLDQIKEPLSARVAAGGTLLMSGILTSQHEAVTRLYEALGFRLVRALVLPEDEGWASLVMTRPAGAAPRP